jgi:hypothetical protein
LPVDKYMQYNINCVKRMTDKDKTIFRYKFSEPVVEDLHNFAKIHQYDDRVSYNEAWIQWTEENKELISRESERLKSLDYDGDILDKMFKSARYYYRKKGTEKKAPAKRREYVGLQKAVLDKMDQHISSVKKDFKPAKGYADFCEQYPDMICLCVSELKNQNLTDNDEIQNKIKKTYKNRYFIAINK